MEIVNGQPQIGRKIYYEKTNGIILWDCGEKAGDVIETTLEQDTQFMPVLTLIDPEQLGRLQLEYGQFKDEFSRCRCYKVNPETETLEFILTPKEEIPLTPEQQISKLQDDLLIAMGVI